ncbi:M23 family metallopeptidase [Roseibium sp.]|uniref:M23 family metallopeptidase n=1 Tax=Roseibium sp. TaxID=1936156 RepID=UPI003B50966F
MMRRFGTFGFVAGFSVGFGLIAGTPLQAEDFELTLPVDCTLGKDCFVQNYVDIDPTSAVLTASCDQAGYDGHKGTDLRVLNTSKSTDVVASAPGVVKGVRDEMPDRLVLTEDDRKQVGGKECGNGVVIAHDDGWETQYCHLQLGSVTVKPGQSVERGAKLGRVGYSGFAAFPHVHLSVRKNGQMIDPFLGTEDNARSRLETCQSDGRGTLQYEDALWQSDVNGLLTDGKGKIIETGFADAPVKSVDVERDTVKSPSAGSSALVYFARLINVRKGDRIALRLVGPQGVLAETDGKPIERQKAQWVAFAGRKLKQESWPAGNYVGTAMLIRDGEIIQQETSVLSL